MISFSVVSLSVCASIHGKAVAERRMVLYTCAGSGGQLALSTSSGSRRRRTAPCPSGTLAAYVQQLRRPTSRNCSFDGSSHSLSSVMSS